ncbi:antitoxin Xre/MbcA/ParS toxin-binding domain-containing protein [Algoriphagus hitonicola]|uniref:Putative toxin-antitoxin system antitoxin component, TIGR02293 family n=1 Tax=Algoriphagus hitonicola TaxID=435880 RepID=A0A1I2S7E2_9BACT|nr:antitoxin Xre/MbcA/ParS toxin-binding domain-containing protein [Algoriphagus hitonicola]SFG48752.1 putative toxin-antitoxin system antitoxin component, TIGR02293 family [Algoriphagus hitonicola]
MSKAWTIAFSDGKKEEISFQSKPYYFFQESISSFEEPAAVYQFAINFHQTKSIFDYLGFTQQDISEMMEVDPSTLFRWRKEDRKLSKATTKSLFDMDQIIALGVRIFGSEELFSEWLRSKNSSLGDRRPVDLLKNPYGIEQVESVLEGLSWGAVQ